MSIHIRPIQKEDIPALKDVLHTIDLFPAVYLDDMIASFFSDPDGEEFWFTAVQDDRPISIGYCAPEQLTVGTHNLLAIGVRKDVQSLGVGQQMMKYIEQQLKQNGQRLLIVETSSTDALERSRQFYEKLGYSKEATIRDFWNEGDDKVVYWKKL